MACQRHRADVAQGLAVDDHVAASASAVNSLHAEDWLAEVIVDDVAGGEGSAGFEGH